MLTLLFQQTISIKLKLNRKIAKADQNQFQSTIGNKNIFNFNYQSNIYSTKMYINCDCFQDLYTQHKC